MFSKLALVFTASLALFAASLPTDSNNNQETYVEQCTTGDAYCCNSSSEDYAENYPAQLGYLSLLLSGVQIPVLTTCSPTSVIAIQTGAKCVQQPVCCQKNQFNGVIAVGCNPIFIGA